METIVAIATPIGKSGIGVIRLSGENSLTILKKLIVEDGFQPTPRKTYLKKIFDPQTNEVVDEAIVTYFQSPQSFTGEDVVEISCHGSPVLLRQIIDFCLKLSARIANAGEFTLRALANSRLNLSQAEAIRDLIEAQTVASSRQAIRQLRGELSNQLQPLKDDLLNVIVLLESTLEFVEDDLPELQSENVKTKLREISYALRQMSDTFQAGKLLREGLRVAFVGRPNVGKSSIFNALLGQERAIVTNIAGTTRDSLHEKLVINNIPISLIDTAGLRETSDTVESLGVERTKQTLADADLVVLVLDNSEKLTFDDKQILEEIADLNHLIAINKIDLEPSVSGLEDNFEKHKTVKISAKTKAGLDDLSNLIVNPFISPELNNNTFLISDARHHDLLLRAHQEIETSRQLFIENYSEEIVLVGLHNSLRYLGEITGETTTEDMLTRIFSTFCIGK